MTVTKNLFTIQHKFKFDETSKIRHFSSCDEITRRHCGTQWENKLFLMQWFFTASSKVGIMKEYMQNCPTVYPSTCDKNRCEKIALIASLWLWCVCLYKVFSKENSISDLCKRPYKLWIWLGWGEILLLHLLLWQNAFKHAFIKAIKMTLYVHTRE